MSTTPRRARKRLRAPAHPRPTRRRRHAVQLSLSSRGSHGGYRAGAGRKRIPRDARGYVPHITRPRVTRHTPVHVTLRCVEGIPSLRRPTHKHILDGIFARESRKGFRLVHYSIQTNHLHLICEGDDTLRLSRGIQRVASRIARALNKRLDRRGKVFRERFDGKVLATPKQTRHALRYVLLNHHKHAFEAAGEILEGLDPYSTAACFDGWARRNRHKPPRDAPVHPATCWLLRSGWRRHGAIAPTWA